MIPIFVLHVSHPDCYTDRKDVVRKRLDELGLPCEVVNAVNGNNLTPEQNARIISDEESRLKFNGFVMAPYQKGCALSHLDMYERIVAEGIEEALILEDDAIVHDTLPDFLANLDQLPKDRFTTFLFHHGGGKTPSGVMTTGHRVLVFIGAGPAGTVGYLITLAGAKHLLKNAYPVQVAADGLSSTCTNSYGIAPWIVGHKGYDANE